MIIYLLTIVIISCKVLSFIGLIVAAHSHRWFYFEQLPGEENERCRIFQQQLIVSVCLL